VHEASLMANLMHQITALAKAQQTSKVTAVQLTLGALSHISPEHLREHFLHASRGTVAEGACLDINVDADITGPWAQDIRLDCIEVEV
jgi:hydrogenase nickel incorporation protein HypA/HybF